MSTLSAPSFAPRTMDATRHSTSRTSAHSSLPDGDQIWISEGGSRRKSGSGRSATKRAKGGGTPPGRHRPACVGGGLPQRCVRIVMGLGAAAMASPISMRLGAAAVASPIACSTLFGFRPVVGRRGLHRQWRPPPPAAPHQNSHGVPRCDDGVPHLPRRVVWAPACGWEEAFASSVLHHRPRCLLPGPWTPRVASRAGPGRVPGWPPFEQVSPLSMAPPRGQRAGGCCPGVVVRRAVWRSYSRCLRHRSHCLMGLGAAAMASHTSRRARPNGHGARRHDDGIPHLLQRRVRTAMGLGTATIASLTSCRASFGFRSVVGRRRLHR